MTQAKIKTKTFIQRVMMMVLTASLMMSVAGCQGTDSRRVPVGETTRPELDSAAQLPVSLAEFQEGAANDILQALPTVRGISDNPERSTILLGQRVIFDADARQLGHLCGGVGVDRHG